MKSISVETSCRNNQKSNLKYSNEKFKAEFCTCIDSELKSVMLSMFFRIEYYVVNV